MCVICVKPKGVSLPSNKIIRAMYQANHDGCGFCTPTKSYKGLSLASFMSEIAKVSKDEPCIMHFRLATHGSVKRDNCHPFYDGETGTWFAHNGVLNVRPKRDTTDSETAFREIFVPYIKQYGLNADETRYTIRQVLANTSSKFAFLQGEDLQLFGEYKQLANGGCWYSNLRFMYYMNDYRTRYNITFI